MTTENEISSRAQRAQARQTPSGNSKSFLAWRQRNGLSLTDAAKALSLSRRTIAYYSNGERAVPDHVILACKYWEQERLGSLLPGRRLSRRRQSPDSHDVAERARLLSHMVYADAIGRDPNLVQRAAEETRRNVEEGDATLGERLWDYLFKHHRHELVDQMMANSEGGRLLRSNSPFSRLIGIRDPESRSILWKIARIEASTFRT